MGCSVVGFCDGYRVGLSVVGLIEGMLVEGDAVGHSDGLFVISTRSVLRSNMA